jgi:hypothetical protein
LPGEQHQARLVLNVEQERSVAGEWHGRRRHGAIANQLPPA